MNKMFPTCRLLLLTVTMLMAPPLWAASNFVMTVKGGGFSWLNEEQQTTGQSVIYEDVSRTIAIGFEHRKRAVALGAEIIRLTSQWDAVAPASSRPSGEVDLLGVNFVARKYFRPMGDFVPFAGLGLGVSSVSSSYSEWGVEHVDRDVALLYQVNLGGELRWEGVGLVLELKYLGVDTEDSVFWTSKDRFPDISGVTGLVGVSFLF